MTRAGILTVVALAFLVGLGVGHTVTQWQYQRARPITTGDKVAGPRLVWCSFDDVVEIAKSSGVGSGSSPRGVKGPTIVFSDYAWCRESELGRLNDAKESP